MVIKPPHIIYGLSCLSFWLFAASLPPVQVGFWVDSEFVLVCNQLLAGLLGVCLIWQRCHAELTVSWRSCIFLATACLSYIVTLWAHNPYLHHWDVPMLGEGTTMAVSLSLLSLGFDQLHGSDKRGIA